MNVVAYRFRYCLLSVFAFTTCIGLLIKHNFRMIKSSIKSCKNHDLKFTKCPNHKQSQVQNKNNVQQGFNSRCFHISFLI